MKRRYLFVCFGAALFGLAACGSPPPPGVAGDTPLTLNDTVRQAVTGQLKDYKPPVPSAEIGWSAVDQMPSRSIGTTMHQTYRAQDNGLWSVVSQGSNTMTGPGGVGESLSLCGLVTLLSVGHGQEVRTVPTLVPVGPVFLPFSIRSTNDATFRRRVIAFQTDAPAICNPAPGSRFSYAIEIEQAFRTSGMFGANVGATLGYRDACEVGAARPAREIDPALPGQGMLVTCNRVMAKTGQSGTNRFVFLPDVGLFLDLDSVTKDATHRVRYESLAR
jgi:hypothetical protein